MARPASPCRHERSCTVAARFSRCLARVRIARPAPWAPGAPRAHRASAACPPTPRLPLANRSRDASPARLKLARAPAAAKAARASCTRRNVAVAARRESTAYRCVQASQARGCPRRPRRPFAATTWNAAGPFPATDPRRTKGPAGARRTCLWALSVRATRARPIPHAACMTPVPPTTPPPLLAAAHPGFLPRQRALAPLEQYARTTGNAAMIASRAVKICEDVVG